MNFFTKLFRSRDKPKNYLSGRLSFLFGQTSAGHAVNERSAMQVTAVYACVRILAEAIAGLPLGVYRYTETGSKEKTKMVILSLSLPRQKLSNEFIGSTCRERA